MEEGGWGTSERWGSRKEERYRHNHIKIAWKPIYTCGAVGFGSMTFQAENAPVLGGKTFLN